MRNDRANVVIRKDPPNRTFGNYSRGDTGWIDGYIGTECASVILESGRVVKVPLEDLECINVCDLQGL